MSLSTSTFGIGEVAGRTGVGVHTSRFYEREGLLLAGDETA